MEKYRKEENTSLKAKLLFLFLAALAFATNLFGYSHKPKTLNQAIPIAKRFYLDYRMQTFYTNTEMNYTTKLRKKRFPLKPYLTWNLIPINSEYNSTIYKDRAKKIEWEHVIPAHWLAMNDPVAKKAWEEGDPSCVTKSGNSYKGRKCAEKVSERFNLMEADLNNLVPVIGALNAIRSDKEYCIIPGEERKYGENIDFESNSTCVEIMESKRGNVARIMLKMKDKFNLVFPHNERTLKLLKEWNRTDPESEWEKKKFKILKDTFGPDY